MGVPQSHQLSPLLSLFEPKPRWHRMSESSAEPKLGLPGKRATGSPLLPLLSQRAPWSVTNLGSWTASNSQPPPKAFAVEPPHHYPSNTLKHAFAQFHLLVLKETKGVHGREDGQAEVAASTAAWGQDINHPPHKLEIRRRDFLKTQWGPAHTDPEPSCPHSPRQLCFKKASEGILQQEERAWPSHTMAACWGNR